MAKKISENVQGILYKSEEVRKSKEKVADSTAQESIFDTIHISRGKAYSGEEPAHWWQEHP